MEAQNLSFYNYQKVRRHSRREIGRDFMGSVSTAYHVTYSCFIERAGGGAFHGSGSFHYILTNKY